MFVGEYLFQRKFKQAVFAVRDRDSALDLVQDAMLRLSSKYGDHPASEFPMVEEVSAQQALTVSQSELKRLIDKTHFSMAQQDVRYYLNGTLLETDGKELRAVATDGHRLAIAETPLTAPAKAAGQVIVPRKGILELQRILSGDGELELSIGSNHVRAQVGDIRFTSKLIDGRFPEYGRVIPAAPPRLVRADREALRRALQRTSILANEKYRGIRPAFGYPSCPDHSDKRTLWQLLGADDAGIHLTEQLSMVPGAFRQVMPWLSARPERGRTWASAPSGLAASAWCRAWANRAGRMGLSRSRARAMPRRAAK